MKCHCSRTFVAILAFSVAVNFVSCDSESDPDPSSSPDLEAEHRGAKTEPFLDRIASFFGGGSNDKKAKPTQVSPVYQRPGLQAQASQQRPVVATRPSGSGYGAPSVSTYGAPSGSTYGAPSGNTYGAPPPPPPVRPPVRSPPPQAPVSPARPPPYQPPVAASNNIPTFVNPANSGKFIKLNYIHY